MLIRYLQATRWDYKKTLEAVMEHHVWYTQCKPYLPPSNEAMSMLQRGFIYIHKRDKRGRCNVIIDVPRFAKEVKSEDVNFPAAVNFLLTYMIEKGTLMGKAETWNMIINLKDLGVTDVPNKALKGMMSTAQTYFRGRAYRVFVVNAGIVARGSFKIVKVMLDDFTAQKV